MKIIMKNVKTNMKKIFSYISQKNNNNNSIKNKSKTVKQWQPIFCEKTTYKHTYQYVFMRLRATNALMHMA